MAWVRIDDRHPDDPRQAAIGVAGRGFFLDGLCYTNRAGTDGWIPHEAAMRFVTPTEEPGLLIERLVKFGLWAPEDRDGIRGYSVSSDFMKLQMTKAEVEERRRVRADAGHKGGLRSGEARRNKAGSNDEASAPSIGSRSHGFGSSARELAERFVAGSRR